MENNIEKWLKLVKEAISLKYANIALEGEKNKTPAVDIMVNMDIAFDEIMDIIFDFPFDGIGAETIGQLSELTKYNIKIFNETLEIIY